MARQRVSMPAVYMRVLTAHLHVYVLHATGDKFGRNHVCLSGATERQPWRHHSGAADRIHHHACAVNRNAQARARMWIGGLDTPQGVCGGVVWRPCDVQHTEHLSVRTDSLGAHLQV